MYYEGVEGEAIRLLNENTVETVVLLSHKKARWTYQRKSRVWACRCMDVPNAVEELKQPRKHPMAEKVDAIKDALKHFEVI